MGTRGFLAAKFKMATLFQLVKLFSRKRRAVEEFLRRQYKIKFFNEEVARKRFIRDMDFETKASEPTVMSAIVITKSYRNERGLDELRNGDWWTNGYQNWDEASFKKRPRVSRDTFQFILAQIKDLIKKEPTRMKPHPTLPATLLAFFFLRSSSHACLYTHRRIMRPDELSFVVRRSRRTTKDSSSRRIIRLVPVFILKTHNQTNYRCLPKFVLDTDNASLV